MRKIILAAALLLLLPMVARAEGQLNIVGKFLGGGNEFDVAQFTEGAAKVAIIGIAANNQRTSVAFAPNEWHSFAGLWQQARGVNSATWNSVGNFKETGTDEAALLEVAAGPAVQFTITGKKGPFVFVLQPGDYTQFGAAVRQTTAWTAE
jgi:hypothetical protein